VGVLERVNSGQWAMREARGMETLERARWSIRERIESTDMHIDL
jgi:hypothetical protein